MDLRTKLVFSLVAVALVSMLALGTLAYRSAEEPLIRKTLRQLDALAQVRESQLRAVGAGWRENVRLVASRTQLRRSTRAFGDSGATDERERVAEILADAIESSRSIRDLAVYDTRGGLIAATGEAPEPFDSDRAVDAEAGAIDQPRERLLGIEEAEDGATSARFVAPLVLDSATVGWLRAGLATDPLLELTSDYTGLGDTGETLILRLGGEDEGAFLTPARHARTEPDNGRVAASGSPERAALLAASGREGTYTEGVVDYRGEPVWAAVRALPELGLGLVVKFDAAEELAPLMEYRERLVRVGFSLSALAILAGVLLGLHFTRPIHDLAAVANRIRGGELGARADAEREDELGILADAFNAMSDELQDRMTLLQEFKRFFDRSRDMLCIAGTDGYFKKVNPAFERTLGWSEQDLLGRPFLDFVHPDDMEKTLEETERLGRGIPTISFQNRYLLPDGDYAMLHWTCHPEPETGQLYAAARIVDEGA
jgi:PAS domain S-box-containing protein